MNIEERAQILEKGRQLAMVDVAHALDMSLKPAGAHYTWTEHDSLVIDTRKNMFYWNSQGFGGDNIKLIQTVKDCDFNEALSFLDHVQGKTFQATPLQPKEFTYRLKDHQKFNLASQYLQEERGLSAETIHFFKDQGLISQASYLTDYENKKSEPVIVFKNKVKDDILGISVQGVWQKKEYGKRGHLKRTKGNGFAGFQVVLGKVPTKPTAHDPLRVIAFEAPIDLLSYYELYHQKLDNTVLVAMNGLRKGTISQSIANQINPEMAPEKKPELMDFLEGNEIFDQNAIQVILAVDHDEAGQKFIDDFHYQHIQVAPHQPPKMASQEKMDWNDFLKGTKGLQTDHRPNFQTKYETQKTVALSKQQSFSMH
ncbi:toprim domain-containing protein [Fructobacillus tropaeoli]|uniref:PcfD protein n=1 Tax=Fructobacillus tropaeoli TaxID=709323 RepID=A0A3F3H613_9LACO|nr:toprim domain-containing protein [Fructobacillus tropaeoli]GAP04992.1 PcfD protein [Fructobacillus tropaeoli]